MPRRAWSLAAELATLVHAVGTVRRLADADASGASPGDLTATMDAIAGSLALVECRMRDLGRVVRGELDPATIWATHNAAASDVVPEPDEVVFRAWGPKRRKRAAEGELTRAATELARGRR